MVDVSKLILPDDTVIDTHIHGSDLYIIYVRSVLRVPNFLGGNIRPEEAHTIEMADYYSYEYPILADDSCGNLWCHIGGRLFIWEERWSRWIEKAKFFVDSLLRVEDDVFVFANHLQQDADPHGTKTYNYKTGELTLNKSTN